METGTNSMADSSPMYFNAKLGTPENSIAKGSPSSVVGGYNFGTKTGVATQNNGDALFTKTLPSLGRFPAGYYRGSRRVLIERFCGGFIRPPRVCESSHIQPFGFRRWMAGPFFSCVSRITARNSRVRVSASQLGRANRHNEIPQHTSRMAAGTPLIATRANDHSARVPTPADDLSAGGSLPTESGKTS